MTKTNDFVDLRLFARHRLRVVRLLYLRNPCLDFRRSCSSRRASRCGFPQHVGALLRRFPDPPVGRVRLRLASATSSAASTPSSSRSSAWGCRHRAYRPHADLRLDRAGRGLHPLVLRLFQGLCLGGEYGGAITYVAEHSPDGSAGTTPVGSRRRPRSGSSSRWRDHRHRPYLGDEAFNEWGWRLPFLFSLPPRRSRGLHPAVAPGDPDLPGDQGEGADGCESLARGVPESQYQLRADRLVVVLGTGIVWYSGQFWALFFLRPSRRSTCSPPA